MTTTALRRADRRATARPPYDWPSARAWYERDGLPLLRVAERLGCTYRAVTLRKAREGWTRPALERAA